MERDLRPLCAVCGRRVDELRYERDERSSAWVFEVRCHGTSEGVIVPDLAFVGESPAIWLKPGIAFPSRDWLVVGGRPIQALHQAAAAPGDG